MWKYTLVLAIILFFSNTYLHNFLSKFSTVSHRVCAERFESVGSTEMYYKIVVCGESAKSRKRNNSDVRLIMVSSLQIVWLEILLALYFNRRSILGSIIMPIMLIQYSLATQLCPAIVRTCLQLFVQKTAWSEKWGWPPIYSSTAAGILTIIVFPQFGASIGFLIGWIAATCARCVAFGRWRPWLFLLMLYPIFFWNVQSPAAIVEWLARPVLIAVLIPPCFAVFIFPVLHRLIDPLWWAYEYFIRTLNRAFGPADATAHPSLIFLWLYLIATLAFGLWFTRRARRYEVFACANS